MHAMTPHEETAAVKAALTRAGIPAAVRHGTGTACTWLKISVADRPEYGAHVPNPSGPYPRCAPTCPRCHALDAVERQALATAQAVTGRQGEYDGRIQIATP